MRRSGALFLCLLAAGCLPARREPSPPPVVEAPKPDLGLSDLSALRSFCLPRALSAVMGAVGGGDEERLKVAFDNYHNAFLDAKGTREYIACLDANKPAGAAGKRHEAEGWLKMSEKIVAESMPLFPEGKRIVDVEESFVDVDAKIGLRRLVITLRDGTKRTVESRFDRLP